MRAVYLPLLPIPALAVAVAIGACSAPRSEEPPTHLVPPAIALAPPPATDPAPAPARTPEDDAPSADELRAFERPVAK